MNFFIKHIKIENFRCIDHLESDLWKNTTIEADNEAGKSTIASAILWTLTGKNVEGESSFEIVPTGKFGVVSPLVEMECFVGEKPVTLKREYKAKYTRDKEFSEYSATTYINGIETGIRKFQEWISKNICDENVFKILSNPKTFLENCPKDQKETMWMAQRRLILSILGDEISDLKIAESDKRFSLLIEPLKRYDSATQYLSFIKKNYSETQKELDSFDLRIKEQEKGISETNRNLKDIENDVAKLKEEYKKEKDENQSKSDEEFERKVNEIKSKIKEVSSKREIVLKKYRIIIIPLIKMSI